MKVPSLRLLLLVALLLARGCAADDSYSFEEEERGDSDEDDDEPSSHAHEAAAVAEPEVSEGGHDDPENPHISFATGSETEHLHNFKRIADDLKLYEDEYVACVDAIHDEDYSEASIQGCLGRDFVKLQLDVKYETMKVISRAEDKLRHFFVYACYLPAGADEVRALACDLLQRDMLDALWNCMDFVELADANRAKYTEEYANMPMAAFKDLLGRLDGLHREFFELVEEIDAHKQVTLLRIKSHIDERTQVLVRRAEREHEQRALKQPVVVTHTIRIEEKVKDPNFRLTSALPRVGVLPDGSPDLEYLLHAKNVRATGVDARGERENRSRMLNLGEGYAGLHSSNREGARKFRSDSASLKSCYRAEDERPAAAFRNIHTSYLAGAHKRFN